MFFCEESVLWYFLCTHSHSTKKSFKEFINKSFLVILISSSPTRTERSILYLYCPYSTARDENDSILYGVPFFTAGKSSCCSETIFGAILLFDWQSRKSAWKQRKITPETPEREEPRRQRGVDQVGNNSLTFLTNTQTLTRTHAHACDMSIPSVPMGVA